MLQSEIIYNIKNLRAGGLQSTGEDLSDAQYAFIIDYYRAKLIKQDIDRGKQSRSQDVQSLGKVTLLKSTDDCCEIGECTLRTVLTIPSFLEFNSTALITFVGTIDGQPFQFSKENRLLWDQFAKYTGKLTKWSINNDYIYITNPPTTLLKYITIRGVFEHPKLANEFKTCDCEDELTCNRGYDFEYPLSLDRVDLIVKLIAETEFRILQTIAQDDLNDGQSPNRR
jgi:hypothetical protein